MCFIVLVMRVKGGSLIEYHLILSPDFQKEARISSQNRREYINSQESCYVGFQVSQSSIASPLAACLWTGFGASLTATSWEQSF